MKTLTVVGLLQEHCKTVGKWGIFLALPSLEAAGFSFDEALKATPYLDMDGDSQMLADGYGFIICDSQEECETIYWQTVGDDGPTESNPYDGPARCYALTVGSDGRLMNENT